MKLQPSSLRRLSISLLTMLVLVSMTGLNATAASDNPQSGSLGLEGTIPTSAPTTPASIVTPSNNSTSTTTPVTVSGLCTSGLLVKIFDNNVFSGSTICDDSSYTLKVDLFNGQNDLIARVYDALDQPGPDSNTIRVTLNDALFSNAGTQVILTSQYGRRGADPNQELTWPIEVSGGSGPYAFSVDWGDGSSASLLSVRYAGSLTIAHTYTEAGTYSVTVQATDVNGLQAYLQLVAVADGQVSQTSVAKSGAGTTQIKTQIIWWPALGLLPLIFIAFWLGQRHELFTLRKRLDNDRSR